MSETHKLPEAETMTFLTQAEQQFVYMALTLAKQSYDGDSESAVKAMRNAPESFDAKARRYITTKPPRILLMQLLHGVIIASVIAVFAYGPFELEWIDWLLGFLIVCVAIRHLHGLQNRFRIMSRQLQLVLLGLSTKPDKLEAKELAAYVAGNDSLQQLAAQLGSVNSMTMRELVMLKHCELKKYLGRAY